MERFFRKIQHSPGFLTPKENENGFYVSLRNRSIQDLSDHGASKKPKNALFQIVGTNLVFSFKKPAPLGKGPSYAWGIWKRKRIKCFPSTLPRRNLKAEVSLWKRIKCFPSTTRRRGIWQRSNNRSVWICDWGKFGRRGQGNKIIFVISSFSKTSVLKTFFVHT